MVQDSGLYRPLTTKDRQHEDWKEDIKSWFVAVSRPGVCRSIGNHSDSETLSGSKTAVSSRCWELIQGDSRIVAVAIHNGHRVREEVEERLAISDADRLREEDPFTGTWTEIADTRIIGTISRFEVDLNRARDKAVYITPEDAWGLRVWKKRPSPAQIARSLAEYDSFYGMAYAVLSETAERFGKFIVLDLHTYNHRRSGPNAPPDDSEQNPEVNIGTGSMDRKRWSSVVDRFLLDLRGFDFLGRRLDVRENVKFMGGRFSRWVHEEFPQAGCCLAVEVKKFFMNEWSGELDSVLFEAIHRALRSTVPGILEELDRLNQEGQH